MRFSCLVTLFAPRHGESPRRRQDESGPAHVRREGTTNEAAAVTLYENKRHGKKETVIKRRRFGEKTEKQKKKKEKEKTHEPARSAERNESHAVECLSFSRSTPTRRGALKGGQHPLRPASRRFSINGVHARTRRFKIFRSAWH